LDQLSGALIIALVMAGFAGFLFLGYHVRREGQRYEHREYRAGEGSGNGHRSNGHSKNGSDEDQP
jgi:hypothetical protein